MEDSARTLKVMPEMEWSTVKRSLKDAHRKKKMARPNRSFSDRSVKMSKARTASFILFKKRSRSAEFLDSQDSYEEEDGIFKKRQKTIFVAAPSNKIESMWQLKMT